MDRNARWCRVSRTTLDVFGFLFVVVSILSVLYYWDPTRIYIKRLKAADEFQYDTVDPRFLAMNPNDFITIHNPSEAEAARSALINVIWGEAGIPLGEPPDVIHKNIHKITSPPSDCAEKEHAETHLRLLCQAGKYANWANLSGIDELVTAVGPVYTASMAFFRPTVSNGTLVVYQNGYASTYHGQYRYLKELVEEGYAVLAANHIGYGDNYCYLPIEKRPWCDVGWGEFEVPLPMRVHFSPLVKAINYGLQQKGMSRVAMIGFSAGGWLTSVMAAVDARIVRSYPVAGFMPRFLQREGEKAPNQKYEPLFEAASMLDQFILGASGGASGPARRQTQFFNKFDRCCYAGERALIYEEAVRASAGVMENGSFDVVIDETHPRHKISRWTFNKILADLKQPDG